MQWPASVSFCDGDVPTIAVIGAGAAGAATAYYLNEECASRFGAPVQTHVFERSDIIGGRVKSITIDGQVIELGASIFVDANTNLIDAVKTFNLSFADDGPANRLAIWDGEDYVFRQNMADADCSFRSPWACRDAIRLVWKYGYSVYRASRHVSFMVDRFRVLYSHLGWHNTTRAVEQVGLLDYTSQTGTQSFATQAGVSDRYIHDVVAAGTRVNYAQSPDDLHAVMTAVGFFADTSHAVKGGNARILQHMLNHSNVSLSTPVERLERRGNCWQVGSRNTTRKFDAVVLATPFHSSNITIDGQLNLPLAIEYVHLYVTIIYTSSKLSPQRFGEDPPEVILTTDDEQRFQSISRVAQGPRGDIYKIFSLHNLVNDELSEFFDRSGMTHQIVRQQWDAYPRGRPTDTFDPVELGRNLFYANGFERFVSLH